MLFTTPKIRKTSLFAAAAALIALAATACGSSAGPGSSGGGSGQLTGPVAGVSLKGAHFTVGSKDFTESILLSKMMEDLLTGAGATVTDKTNIKGSVNTRDAMLSGNIDMYWDYTGTGWLVYLKHTTAISDQQQQYQAVQQQDLAQNKVVWLQPTPMSDTYAFAVPQAEAKTLNITSDSQLAALPASAQTFCLESEFEARPDGWPGFKKAYGLSTPASGAKTLATGAIYQITAKGGTCNFGEVFTTDGRIPALKLVVLKDDKSFFPHYNAALTLMKSTYDKYPQIAKLANVLASKITDDEMRTLNAEVDVQGQSPDAAALAFLKQAGLLS